MAADYFLELTGIKGESEDHKHKGKIAIEAFSWGASQSGGAGTTGGLGRGKVSFQELHLTAQMSKASVSLFVHCATGQHIEKATLFVRKAGGNASPEDYYTIKLQDLLVTSYQTGGSGGGGQLPMDQFSLATTKIEIEYKTQDEKGKMTPAGTFKYDRKTNKAG
jgi:type VI secretion system secreted protein Hcp